MTDFLPSTDLFTLSASIIAVIFVPLPSLISLSPFKTFFFSLKIQCLLFSLFSFDVFLFSICPFFFPPFDPQRIRAFVDVTIKCPLPRRYLYELAVKFQKLFFKGIIEFGLSIMSSGIDLFR